QEFGIEHDAADGNAIFGRSFDGKKGCALIQPPVPGRYLFSPTLKWRLAKLLHLPHLRQQLLAFHIKPDLDCLLQPPRACHTGSTGEFSWLNPDHSAGSL